MLIFVSAQHAPEVVTTLTGVREAGLSRADFQLQIELEKFGVLRRSRPSTRRSSCASRTGLRSSTGS